MQEEERLERERQEAEKKAKKMEEERLQKVELSIGCSIQPSDIVLLHITKASRRRRDEEARERSKALCRSWSTGCAHIWIGG